MTVLAWVRRGRVKALIERIVIPVADLLLLPATLAAALLLKLVRRVGVYRMKASRAVFNRVGVFPIRDHYYEPAFNPRHLRRPLDAERRLPGLDLNVAGQLAVLNRFRFADELRRLPISDPQDGRFHYDNPNFLPGDADYFYSLIRAFRPRCVLEVGSGFSTLLARAAIDASVAEDASYSCRHVCIEPYEMPFLDRLPGIEVVRERVEDVDPVLFQTLGDNDILFIDSSHVIRPQGDVLLLFLEILPLLRPGVFVHVHDIFTPQDYPSRWLIDEVRLWNEQYLLEAFLSCNDRFEVVGALGYLARHHTRALAAKLPVFGADPARYQPGSFWVRRR